MTTSKSFARSLMLALAAVSLLGLSLGPVLGDDDWTQPSTGETRDNPAAAQPAADQGSEVSDLAEPGCELDLSVLEATARSPLEPEAQLCPVDSPDSLFPVRMGPPFKQGYCRCGCGLRCETSADCGGTSCDLFITCC